MNPAISRLYNEFLKETGDKAAAASLTLASVLVGERQPEQALTVEDAASRLRVNRATIYNLCRSGKLKCHRAGRSIRIPVEELDHLGETPEPAPKFPDIFKRYC